MQKELRNTVFDDVLGVEAFELVGVTQPFPSHFHSHYVLGLMQAGRRQLICAGQSVLCVPGDILVFNPGDAHACTHAEGEALHWCSFNVNTAVLADAAEGLGHGNLPVLQNVLHSETLFDLGAELHSLVMQKGPALQREQAWLFFVEELLGLHEAAACKHATAAPQALQNAKTLLLDRLVQTVTLDELAACAGLNKYTFLRAFTRHFGLTPWQYLQTMRVQQAAALLQAGVPPVEAALQTGFADQSHFTRVFKQLIGVPPGQYGQMFK